LTSLCRSWKDKGVDFEVKIKMGRENLYTFGVIAPATGELFTRNYEKSNTAAMQEFLNEAATFFHGRHVLMILDRAGWHTTGKLKVPDNITLHFLPPTSPQLNPIERLWRHIKINHFHNVIHDTIEDVKASVSKGLHALTNAKVASICSCAYIEQCL
jgi:transposase